MYDVYPYSMFGFLQLIADGSIKEKKKRKGRKRREYKRTPHQNKKNTRQELLDQNCEKEMGVPN